MTCTCGHKPFWHTTGRCVLCARCHRQPQTHPKWTGHQFVQCDCEAK